MQLVHSPKTLVLVISLACAFCAQPAAHAQTAGNKGAGGKAGAAARRRQQEARHKRAMNSFWTEFQAAIAAGDKEKVAGMVQYPFSSAVLAIGESDPDVADAAAFRRKYAALFPADLRRQIKRGRPYLVDPDTGEFYFEYVSQYGPLVFIFQKIDGTYKLTNTMAPG